MGVRAETPRRVRVRVLSLLIAACAPAAPQSACPPTPTYSPCEIVFELNDAEAAANHNPYLTVRLDVEFRSPRFRTYRLPAFWDGGRRMVVRFSPVDPGEWVYRVTGNLPRLEGQEGKLTATDSQSPGFVLAANVHHWALVDDLEKTPHLWMGDTLETFPFIERALFERIVDARAAQKFNHIRGVVLSREGDRAPSFANPDQPDPARFREIDERIGYMNRKGIVADLVLAWNQNQLAKLMPQPEQRARYVRYLVGRYAAMHITWQGVEQFETYENGRALLKEIGPLLKTLDPYHHPRSTDAATTSSPLAGDEWMDFLLYRTPDDQVGAIEHQLLGLPQVNAGFAREDSGAGRAGRLDVDTAEFRRRLWNATMDGQYPVFANTGTYGSPKLGVKLEYADSPGAKQMTAWFDFMSRTRFWELEPYFDVDGGRAVALERPRDEKMEGIEYVVYVEKPGPVEILVQKHSYDVAWFNPVTGEIVKRKGFKADRFSGEPPTNDQDWVLHISREGRKESLRSYKFESRAILLQEVEQSPQRAPFAMAEPAADSVLAAKPPAYSIKLTRENRATRSMMYLWTAEVPGTAAGARVIGTGAKGTWRIPREFAGGDTLAVRLYGMNANGKVYSLFRVWKLTP